MQYLVDELEGSTNAAKSRLASEALLECLVKHRELISGSTLWSPRVRAYVTFQQTVHGNFSVLKPGGPTVVRFLGKLLPVYCRLCLLSECHDQAKAAAQALLRRLTCCGETQNNVNEYEIRTLNFLIDNLSSSPPSEWGEVRRSPDVSVEIKIAVDLLWTQLAILYAGNRKLLLCNLKLFFTRPQNSLELCPSFLRAALFVHGNHEPFSRRKRRHWIKKQFSRIAPVFRLESDAACTGTHVASGVTAVEHIWESRMSRLCWLAALWVLDIECNKKILHWIYKPEPHRV